VFEVETPEGSGSGVFFMRNDRNTLVAVATAAHVVEHAHDWKLPIKLRHEKTKKELFLADGDRAILIDRRRDSASILFNTEKAARFALPDGALSMIPADKFQQIGTEVGWVGYPSIANGRLCFFSGRISAFMFDDDSYLIDGVAINGVSGGPVFRSMEEDRPELLGTVSAYMPNRLRGDALPGLLRAQDVTPFHNVITTLRNLDEGQQKDKEQAATQPPSQEVQPQPPAQEAQPQPPAQEAQPQPADAGGAALNAR
jgi:hypothetical protein